ncbi:TFIIH complex serine/threonine-protein kinase subunit KIN28 [Sporobolomyces koalae]|uniref:TFIIH complex serine/threonine-protein kinase subunit KIN28 n=1 Tax=Sporobolomyces koalae TaxID=500713 RepID=UPI0031700EA5
MEAATLLNLSIQRKYTKDKKVGEGTYAVVYLGRDIDTGKKIAIKKIKVGQFKDGLDMSAIREVKFLRELNHPNVIQLVDVFSNKSNLNLVLEFLDTDLEAVIRDKSLVFQTGDVKSWMLMTFKGLEFCHRNWILHRDMKPNNLLISADGVLKIADFGLAREYADEGAKMTCQVVTRWYRPPELLLGARSYSTGVDTWAAGCIFAELMLRVPFMAGESDMEQLQTIFNALGTPTEREWPGFTKLSSAVQFEPKPRSDLSMLFSAAPSNALSLLTSLLTYDPRKRLDSVQALKHAYFSTSPHPTKPAFLPKPKGSGAGRDQTVEEVGLPLDKAERKKLKRNGDGLDEVPGAKKVARRLEF